MRTEAEIKKKLEETRVAMSSATEDLSKGHLNGLDFTTIASRVGMISALEWALGESKDLSLEVNPLRKPLDEI